MKLKTSALERLKNSCLVTVSTLILKMLTPSDLLDLKTLKSVTFLSHKLPHKWIGPIYLKISIQN